VPVDVTFDDPSIPAAAALNGTEVIPGTQNGVNVKFTPTGLAAAAAAAVPDATAGTKGKIQLAGDLAGTAAAPTVPGLTAKANDSAVVHDTGDETIDGIKTFLDPPVVPTAAFPVAAVSGLQASLNANALAHQRLVGIEVAAPGGVDDTAAVVTARTSAGTGGTVVFAANVTPYVVTGLAASVANQHWIIQPGATVKLKNAADTPTIDVTADGVTIDGGGVIDGNRTNQTVISDNTGQGVGACVRAVGVGGTTVRKLHLKDGRSQAVFGDDLTGPIAVLRNTITGCAPPGNNKPITIYDLVGDSVDIRVEDNDIDSVSRTNGCIGVALGNNRTVRRVQVTGNVCLVGNAGATPTLGIELFAMGTALISDAVVTGNLVIGPAGVVSTDQIYGISIGGVPSLAGKGDQSMSVTGNVVVNCPAASYEIAGRAVALQGNPAYNSGPITVIATNCTGGIFGVSIIGNPSVDCISPAYAIRLDGGANGIFGLVVQGNPVHNPAGPALVTAGLITGAIINGNPFTECNGTGMVLGGTLTDSIIEANGIDLTGVVATADGILIAATTVADNAITNNTIRGATRSGIHALVATSHNTVQNNRVRSCQDGIKAVAAQNHWTVTGNKVRNNVDRGLIFAVASTNLAIASNSIHDNPGGDYYTVGSTFLTHVINGAGG
jgi:parallel beta-helix repeat protein